MKNKIIISGEDFFIHEVTLPYFWPSSGTIELSDYICYLFLIYYDRYKPDDSRVKCKWFIITNKENFNGKILFPNTSTGRPVHMILELNKTINKLPKIEDMSLVSSTKKHLSTEDYDILAREFKILVKG